MDVWRAGGPQIDILSPDIYGNDDFFVSTTASYARSGNPLFIPENGGRRKPPGRSTPSDAMTPWASRLSVSKGTERPTTDLISGYDLITQLAPLIAAHQGKGTMSAVLLGQKNPPQKIQVGNYTLEAAFPRPRSLPGAPPPQPPFSSAAAIFISGA